jgi:hypothetical protein
VNSYALYCNVLEGIKKIHKHIEGLSQEDRLKLSLKLEIRRQMDREAADKGTAGDSSINLKTSTVSWKRDNRDRTTLAKIIQVVLI